MLLQCFSHSPKILDAWPTALRPIAAMAAILFTSAIAVHDAQGDGWDDRYHKRHHKKMNYHGDLVVVVVGGEYDGLVFARIETRIDGALDAVVQIEVLTRHCGRIPAALNVDQQRGLVGLLPVLSVVAIVGHVLRYGYVRLNKRHIDVHTAIQIGGAALATRAPRAVEYANEILASRRRAQRRMLHKIVTERRYRRVYVQRHQEQQRRPGCHREEGECWGAIETRTFPPRTKAPIAIFLFWSQFSDFT